MVRRVNCILSINGNIQKANYDMKTAEFFYYKKNSAVIFFTCCKGGKAFSVVASLMLNR